MLFLSYKMDAKFARRSEAALYVGELLAVVLVVLVIYKVLNSYVVDHVSQLFEAHYQFTNEHFENL